MVEQTLPIDMKEALEIMGNDMKLLQECFNDFVQDYSVLLSNIKESIDASDASELNRTAHRFKGTLKYLAATDAAETAFKLEKMGEEANLDHAYETFQTLCKEIEQLKDYIVNCKESID